MAKILLDEVGLEEGQVLEMEGSSGVVYKVIKLSNHLGNKSFSAGGEFFLMLCYKATGELAWQKILYNRPGLPAGGVRWHTDDIVSFRIKKNATLLVSVVEAINIEGNKEGRLYVGA